MQLIKRNKKGQLTMIGILMVPIILITFAIMLPLINTAISMGLNNTNNTTLQFIINMYPIFIGLGILIMIITYLTIVQPAQ
jgi:ABC-type uncharacterized transport system fused permease/ATPase subunit